MSSGNSRDNLHWYRQEDYLLTLEQSYQWQDFFDFLDDLLFLARLDGSQAWVDHDELDEDDRQDGVGAEQEEASSSSIWGAFHLGH